MGGRLPNQAAWLGGIAAVVAGAVILALVLNRPGVPEAGGETAPEAAQTTAAAPDEPSGPAATETTEAVPEAEPAAGSDIAEPAAATAEAPAAGDGVAEAALPKFDVVRIEPDGGALVAGQAAPGAKVSVIVDGAVVGEGEADASGNFVAQFTLPPEADTRVMTLEADLGTGEVAMAEQSVIIQPAAPAEA
ncbi:MAG: hypothetical protein KDK10_09390, partial [Maritimibacter sp.]|nr:hypothetical protein [Maritimibacter sp.]